MSSRLSPAQVLKPAPNSWAPSTLFAYLGHSCFAAEVGIKARAVPSGGQMSNRWQNLRACACCGLQREEPRMVPLARHVVRRDTLQIGATKTLTLTS